MSVWDSSHLIAWCQLTSSFLGLVVVVKDQVTVGPPGVDPVQVDLFIRSVFLIDLRVIQLDFLMLEMWVMGRDRLGAPVLWIVLVKKAVTKARGYVSVRHQAKKLWLVYMGNSLCCFCGKANLHLQNPLRHSHCSLRMPRRTWSYAQSFPCFMIFCTCSESPWVVC